MSQTSEKRAEPTPGSGRLECDEDGLVVERFADGGCSFDIFDAHEWPGGDKHGMAYASLIVCTAAERDRLLVANGELAEVLEAGVKAAGKVDRAKDLPGKIRAEASLYNWSNEARTILLAHGPAKESPS